MKKYLDEPCTAEQFGVLRDNSDCYARVRNKHICIRLRTPTPIPLPGRIVSAATQHMASIDILDSEPHIKKDAKPEAVAVVETLFGPELAEDGGETEAPPPYSATE